MVSALDRVPPDIRATLMPLRIGDALLAELGQLEAPTACAQQIREALAAARAYVFAASCSGALTPADLDRLREYIGDRSVRLAAELNAESDRPPVVDLLQRVAAIALEYEGELEARRHGGVAAANAAAGLKGLLPELLDTAKFQGGTRGDQYRAELYDEVWAKCRAMGYLNLTGALGALAQFEAADHAAAKQATP